MKVFIWIITIFTIIVLNSLFGLFFGWELTYAALSLLMVLLSIYLCKKWDRYKEHIEDSVGNAYDENKEISKIKRKIIIYSLGVFIILLAVVCVIDVSVTFANGGFKFATDRGLYYHYNITKYITVGEYSKEVSRTSSDYKDAYDAFYTDTFGTDFETKVTEGKVADTDVANIDYVGKLNGEAFDNGSDTGYDLDIDNSNFIEGFADGLIGAQIGKTTNLNLTFPTDYHATDLAGKDVVFEVKVNYVTRKTELTDDNVKRYGFSSLADYEKKAEEYAAKVCLLYNIYDATTFNSYPKKEQKAMYDNTISYFEDFCKANNITLEQFAATNGMTLDEFDEYINEYEIKGSMDFYLVVYYVLQINDTELTEADVEAKRAELQEKYDSNLEEIGYFEINIQQAAAFDKALEVLAGQAEVK